MELRNLVRHRAMKAGIPKPTWSNQEFKAFNMLFTTIIMNANQNNQQETLKSTIYKTIDRRL